MSFFKSDLPAPQRHPFGPDVAPGALDLALRPAAVPLTNSGETQRNYRLAMAADGEYVAAVCPGNITKACGLAAVVQAVNRVNQVYETELGVHLSLIVNNDAIIYLDPGTDPYANDTSDLGTNQTSLDSVIGNANYDVGHVFTTGSGGIAGLGVTCTTGQKGQGTTGLPNPTGDAFYIDYVSHELGHQFGGNHPFNSETDNCGGGNRNPGTAYEPGSGSTIQAYAGICAADDLQAHSDPYFHAIGLSEIDTWIEGAGGNCATQSASTDAPPVIDSGSLPAAGLTVPMHTPIMLSASATDADGDALTYTWEQFDLGNATTIAQGDTGNGPIFRSRPPTASGSQSFPGMAGVLSGTLDKGDAWPTTNRNLNFRLTVRDNHGVPGTPQYGRTTSADAPQIAVTTAAGPFVVTQPNNALTWSSTTTQTVTWNVANTDQAPVNCANVSLRLSTDGGSTFPTILAAGVANDGSQDITVPASTTIQARVKITCDSNVFFDVSDANFTIAPLSDVIFQNGFEPTSITQPLLDPSFEASTGTNGSNPNWQSTDTNSPGATVYYSTASARTGTFVAWFGGWGAASAYTQNVSQNATLEAVSPIYLNYWRRLMQAPASAGDVLSVRVDGNTLSSVDASTLVANGQYVPASVDISAYADGTSHTVELLYTHGSSGNDADLYVDDVTIDMTPIAP